MSLITTTTEEFLRSLRIISELTQSWDRGYVDKLISMANADPLPTRIHELRIILEKVKDWPSTCIQEYFEDALKHQNLSLAGKTIRDYAAELNAVGSKKSFILQQEPEFMSFLQCGAEIDGKKWELRNRGAFSLSEQQKENLGLDAERSAQPEDDGSVTSPN